MRFHDTFGVGHFSAPDDSLTHNRKPVYIDHWEDSVSWEQDINRPVSAFGRREPMSASLSTPGRRKAMSPV